MLKKIFISAVLILAVLSFVVSLLKGNNNAEKTVTVPDRVAVINISGTIISGADSKDNIFSQTNGVTSGSIMKQIREAAADDSVKALVLRIDSGGGSATAAEEVGRELKRFKEKTKKPIVATIGFLVFSLKRFSSRPTSSAAVALPPPLSIRRTNALTLSSAAASRICFIMLPLVTPLVWLKILSLLSAPLIIVPEILITATRSGTVTVFSALLFPLSNETTKLNTARINTALIKIFLSIQSLSSLIIV